MEIYIQMQQQGVFYKKICSQKIRNINREAPVLGFQLKTCTFIKKRLQYGCFPVNIAKFLKILI